MEESLHTDLAERHFVNSLAPIRDRICTGSSSNGFCVTPLRVDWSDLVLCSGFTFVDFLINSVVT